METTIIGDDASGPATTRVAPVEVVAAHGRLVARGDPLDRDRLVGDDEFDLSFAPPDLVDAVPLTFEDHHAVLAGSPLVAGTSGVPARVAGAADFRPFDGELPRLVDVDLLRDEGVRIPGLDGVVACLGDREGAGGSDAVRVDIVDRHLDPLERDGGDDRGLEVAVRVGVRVGIGVGVGIGVVSAVAGGVGILAPQPEGKGQEAENGQL